jgi:predicted lysophospholipase L1 biosynthesis ABC-type transport system permease subunit
MEEKSNEHYLDDLKEIRSMMEKSSRFISLSGLSGISAGIIALVGAFIASWYIKNAYRKIHLTPCKLL